MQAGCRQNARRCGPNICQEPAESRSLSSATGSNLTPFPCIIPWFQRLASLPPLSVVVQNVVPPYKVKTGDGTISAEQKAELHQLLDRWMRAANLVRAKPLTHGAAWRALNRYMKVNSYHEIPAERFAQAAKWLRNRAARSRA